MVQKKKIGSRAENLAAAFLSRQGMVILRKNYQIRQGEIDLIGLEEDTLVFIEVKARRNAACGYPGESLSKEKIKRICYTAGVYCMREKVPPGTQIRFDVVEILKDRIRHIKNAFEYCF